MANPPCKTKKLLLLQTKPRASFTMQDNSRKNMNVYYAKRGIQKTLHQNIVTLLILKIGLARCKVACGRSLAEAASTVIHESKQLNLSLSTRRLSKPCHLVYTLAIPSVYQEESRARINATNGEYLPRMCSLRPMDMVLSIPAKRP